MTEESCTIADSCQNDYDPTEPAKFNTQGFIRIPGLPSLPNLSGLGSLSKSESNTDRFRPVRLRPISELFQNSKSSSSIEKDSDDTTSNFDVHSDINYRLNFLNKSRERIGLNRSNFRQRFTTNGCGEEDEEIEDNKIMKVCELIDKLRRASYKPYTRQIEMDNHRRMKIQKLSMDITRMCLNDYCTAEHHHVWATLIDLKTLFKSENEAELSTKLLEYLKEIREKFIKEGIPSSGAGGHCLYE
jgi:hypothetical protein